MTLSIAVYVEFSKNCLLLPYNVFAYLQFDTTATKCLLEVCFYPSIPKVIFKSSSQASVPIGAL